MRFWNNYAYPVTLKKQPNQHWKCGGFPYLAAQVKAESGDFRISIDVYDGANGPFGKHQTQIFLRIKFPAKMVDHLVDRLRYVVSQTRDLERMILQMAVVQAKMPKSVFLKSFTENEANPKWLTPVLKGKQKWVPALKEYAPEIRTVQEKLIEERLYND